MHTLNFFHLNQSTKHAYHIEILSAAYFSHDVYVIYIYLCERTKFILKRIDN